MTKSLKRATYRTVAAFTTFYDLKACGVDLGEDSECSDLLDDGQAKIRDSVLQNTEKEAQARLSEY